MTPRRFHRSKNQRMLFGVAGGLGEYFDVDPVLVRVGFVFLCFISAGGAVLLYLILAVVTPEEGSPSNTGYSRRRENDTLALVVLILVAIILLAGFWSFAFLLPWRWL